MCVASKESYPSESFIEGCLELGHLETTSAVLKKYGESCVLYGTSDKGISETWDYLHLIDDADLWTRFMEHHLSPEVDNVENL